MQALMFRQLWVILLKYNGKYLIKMRELKEDLLHYSSFHVSCLIIVVLPFNNFR